MSLKSCPKRRSSGKWTPPTMAGPTLDQLESDVSAGFAKLARRSVERKQSPATCTSCSAPPPNKPNLQTTTNYIANHMQQFLEMSVRGLPRPPGRKIV